MILIAVGKMQCKWGKHFVARPEKSPPQEFNRWRQRSEQGGGHGNKTKDAMERNKNCSVLAFQSHHNKASQTG